jgi:hypothetical protein
MKKPANLMQASKRPLLLPAGALLAAGAKNFEDRQRSADHAGTSAASGDVSTNSGDIL